MGLIIFFMLAIVIGIIYAVVRIRSSTPADPKPAAIAKSLSIPRPTDVDGKFHCSFCPDDVKFYPPSDIVSNLPNGIFIPGKEIVLKKEPSNQYDSGAIALYLSGHKIGYMLRNGLQDMVHEWSEKNWPVECTLVSLKKIRGEYEGYIKLSYYRPVEDIPEGSRRLGYSDIDIKTIKPANPEAIPNTPLTGKNIVFSGYFQKSIPEMMQLAVDAGAVLKSRISKSVHYLVVGSQSNAFVDENGMSAKEVTANKLNEQGEAKIRIISEETFLELVALDM